MDGGNACVAHARRESRRNGRERCQPSIISGISGISGILGIVSLCAASLMAPGETAFAASSSRADASATENQMRAHIDRTRRAAGSGAGITAPAIQKQQLDTTLAFLLGKVVIEGATVFTSDEMRPAYSEFLNRRVTSADLTAIVDRLTKQYRDAGYALSRALIVPQDVDDGVVQISIVEGWIDQVEIRGSATDHADLMPYTRALVAERPTRLATMERQLFLMADQRGISITDSVVNEITPGSGRYSLVIQAEIDRFQAIAGMDNYGSTSVGPLQAWATAYANGAFTGQDTLALSASAAANDPKEWRYGELAYDTALGNGLSLGGYVSYGAFEPDGADALVDTEGDTFIGGLRAIYTFYRTRDTDIRATARATLRNGNEDDVLGPNYRDRTRTLAAGVRAYRRNVFGGTLNGGVEIEKGLAVLGASSKGDTLLSNADGDPTFGRISADLSWYRPLGHNWALSLAFSGQRAFDPLLSSQEFYLGGSYVGRGYDTGELSGDDGFGGSLEVQYGRKTTYHWLKSWQIYAFYDGGAVWNRGGGRQSLTSAGAGLRLSLPQNITAGFELAKPLTYRAPDNSNRIPRVRFSVSAAF